MPVLTSNAPWWSHRATLLRVVADLLAGELAQMRPGAARRSPPWPPDLDLAADLGADSLELLGLATAMEGVLAIGAIGEDRLLADPRLGAWVDAAAAGLAAQGTLVNFRTSGSSGAPKTCSHGLADLEQEVALLAGLFAGRRRIIGVVPSHHIYGFLFTVLLPRALGIAPDAVFDLRGMAPGALVRQLCPGDLVVGFPDFWAAFAPVAGTLADDVTGVSSTAPCPPEVACAAVDAGLARLVQVYGSSETAGVGWRAGPDEDYQLFPYWQAGGDGASLERLRPDGSRARYPLQDKLAWSTPGRFRPTGRIDHAVQVGGVNVHPAYVADVLRMHPQVADATVRLMRPDEGKRLKAFVVPRTGWPPEDGGATSTASHIGAELSAELNAWIAQRLPAPERPASYTFGARLPRQASGKAADWIIDTGD